MIRILVVLPMVLSVALAATIVQPVERPIFQSRSDVLSSGPNLPETQEVQTYFTPSNLPDGANPVQPALGYPTYDNYQGYSVRTGEVTYVTPATPTKQLSSCGAGCIISGIFPGPITRFFSNYGRYLFNSVLALGVGVILTIGTCAFTPFCSLLTLGLARAQVAEQVTELARTFMTPEKITAATNLVKRAIDKYSAMQVQPDTEETENTKAEES